jgi:hypothetical protein
MRRGIILLALLVAGCGGTGSWIKPGADAALADSDYRECRAVADSAIKTDANIDQDIAATRQFDWQRAQLGRIAGETMREQTRERGAAIVDSCMRAKGFAPAR